MTREVDTIADLPLDEAGFRAGIQKEEIESLSPEELAAFFVSGGFMGRSPIKQSHDSSILEDDLTPDFSAVTPEPHEPWFILNDKGDVTVSDVLRKETARESSSIRRKLKFRTGSPNSDPTPSGLDATPSFDQTPSGLDATPSFADPASAGVAVADKTPSFSKTDVTANIDQTPSGLDATPSINLTVSDLDQTPSFSEAEAAVIKKIIEVKTFKTTRVVRHESELTTEIPLHPQPAQAEIIATKRDDDTDNKADEVAFENYIKTFKVKSKEEDAKAIAKIIAETNLEVDNIKQKLTEHHAELREKARTVAERLPEAAKIADESYANKQAFLQLKEKLAILPNNFRDELTSTINASRTVKTPDEANKAYSKAIAASKFNAEKLASSEKGKIAVITDAENKIAVLSALRDGLQASRARINKNRGVTFFVFYKKGITEEKVAELNQKINYFNEKIAQIKAIQTKVAANGITSLTDADKEQLELNLTDEKTKLLSNKSLTSKRTVMSFGGKSQTVKDVEDIFNRAEQQFANLQNPEAITTSNRVR